MCAARTAATDLQTFLPYADFGRSARSLDTRRLDTRRLGKQRVECIQVVRGLTRSGCAATIGADLVAAGVTSVRSQAEPATAGLLPSWLGDEAFHRSHQSSLLRKDPHHYGPLFPGVRDDLEYVWPERRTG